jgi:hypothetical protein
MAKTTSKNRPKVVVKNRVPTYSTVMRDDPEDLGDHQEALPGEPSSIKPRDNSKDPATGKAWTKADLRPVITVVNPEKKINSQFGKGGK